MKTSFTDLDSLRAKLQSMSRPDVLALADEAQVSRSTVQKIRHGHIANPAYDKVVALAKALLRRPKPSRLKRERNLNGLSEPSSTSPAVPEPEKSGA